MTHGDLFRACCDELPEITFEQALEQVLNITFQALALASKSQKDEAHELVNQLKTLIFFDEMRKIEKDFQLRGDETSSLGRETSICF